MTVFQNDMIEAQSLRKDAQLVLEKLRALRTAMREIRDTRRRMEDVHVLSYEEWLREQQHLHGHLPDRDSEQVRKQYDAYQGAALRQQDDVRSQLEQKKTRLSDSQRELQQRVNTVKNLIEKLQRRVREADQIASQTKELLDRGIMHMTLEQLSDAERRVEELSWMKDQW